MIHQYKQGGYNIVLDVCSGSVHVVDEVAYDIIAMFEEKSREDIILAMEQKYAERCDISKEDIEECYAQVVEVEAYDGGYVPEPFAMAVQVVEHQDGVVANVFEDTVGWFCE